MDGKIEDGRKALVKLRYLETVQRIAIVNPYSAGSHAQWAAGLARSLPGAAGSAGVNLEVEIHSLPGRHWKWRMHSAALTLVERMGADGAFDRGIDVFIVTDMMDVGQFRAALPRAHREKPIVLYFHENQLTFPAHAESPSKDWDRHYAFINVTGALLADHVWFNSEYHRNLFLEALPEFLSVFPSPRPDRADEKIRSKSTVVPIGIEQDVLDAGVRGRGSVFGEGPPVVAWNHRWEYDKGPASFLRCIDEAAAAGCEFRLAMMGQAFQRIPPAFEALEQRHANRIVCWGHLNSREDYVQSLSSCDVALVTAHHDFFGISVLESAAVGLHLVAPRALAYPEHFGSDRLYPREDLTAAFIEVLRGVPSRSSYSVTGYEWSQVASRAWSELEAV